MLKEEQGVALIIEKSNAGGKLIDIAKQNNLPFYLITPTHNPSNQPRMAIGYSLVGQLVLASKVGILEINFREIENTVNVMRNIIKENDINRNPENNKSIEFAKKMIGKIITYISSEHIIGAAHVINNQLNENAKNLSFDFAIPELNHHLMEGLKHPEENNKNLLTLLFESDLYSERIIQRFKITKEVIQKNNIQSLTLKLDAIDKNSQVFESIQFGAFVNFYLTMLYGIDPAPISWVDYFKEKLGQPLGK